MPVRMLELVAAFVIFSFSAAAPLAQTRNAHKQRAPKTTPRTTPTKAAPPIELPCGDLLGFQVLLDRQGFSPGQIDGKAGTNLTHAIAAMQAARRKQPSGQPDCDAWQTLGGDKAGDPVATYTITDDDLKGPFEKTIPRDLVAQAELPALAYRTPLERLGEKFHASPQLLQQLNPGASFAAGSEIRVPAVEPFDAGAKPPPATGDVTVVVSKQDSALRVTQADGSVVFFAPVTTGSAHDPLPQGNWKVTAVQWNPAFHYNPQLFWDAKPGDTKATIKPGPNNPVGVVWIDLDLEHYGLHGAPEPGNIGRTESHGCVRLTNWDAARVAALVKPGTPVQFR